MREWRQRRRISQLDLALTAEVSPRHVSFMETGRSIPSRTMVMRLAAALDVPPRDQNHLLIAAGRGPGFAGRALFGLPTGAGGGGGGQGLAGDGGGAAVGVA